jgi:2-oxoglutarate dehydrogenase E1 component
MNRGISPENTSFIEELYAEWKRDSGSVPKEWADYFRNLDAGNAAPAGTGSAGNAAPGSASSAAGHRPSSFKQSRVDSLVWAYRDVGYLYSKINPLEGYMPKELEYVYKSIEGMYETLSLKEFGLHEEDMDTDFFSSKHLDPSKAPLGQIIKTLEDTYCSHLGIEFLHIQNKPIRKWLIRKIEEGNNQPNLTDEQRRTVQKDLIKALEFEKFLHSRFIGQKRFSVEGGEVILPALHYLVDTAASNGMEEIVIGMSHRGRLNVLANIFGKPAEQIFSNFEDKDESPTYGASGDVRYHLGYSREHVNPDGTQTHLSLVSNPSHLESVDPVVEGKTRGIQQKRGDKNRKKVMPILFHGDAAFSGQGIVSETFNLSKLKGYETGGTIHIIVNNQIGFTTAARDLRSTFFPTDIAKSLPIPIFHVNGDKPEYVIRALDLAFRFRQKFGYDAIIDIFCYRKYGHNESDDPSFTHPVMYELIEKSPGVTALYGKQLEKSGIFPTGEQQEFTESYTDELAKALESARQQPVSDVQDGYQSAVWKSFQREYSHVPVDTAVEKKKLQKILSVCTTVPDGFSIHSKLKRIVERKAKMLDGKGSVDWSTAEALAFGSILLEGFPIRLSGEDSGRGTFSQRHAVWWSGAKEEQKSYIPLNNISPEQARFSVFDSPLSEYSVLGFEFGFSLAQPNTLVLWEAQFGDFCNGAQVIIDQFLSSSEVKWDRSSGLVMLLPHGYEGQGPEHSSAFLERFLQLCAQDNIQVCNPTTPAQYFHLLRRQLKREFRKPLVIMTPKSLLRSKEAVSQTADFTKNRFQEVVDDPEAAADAETVLLVSGKLYYELAEHRQAAMKSKSGGKNDAGTALIRIEQFYPYPEKQLESVISKYKKAKELRWVQEETKNRGGWRFMHEGLLEQFDLPVRYVGRPTGASPAPGSYSRFLTQQEEIYRQAFAEKPMNGKEA